MKGSNIHYEMSEKAGGISYGGIGVFHQMVKKIGLSFRNYKSQAAFLVVIPLMMSLFFCHAF